MVLAAAALLLCAPAAPLAAPPAYKQVTAFHPTYPPNASAVTGVSACAVGTGSDQSVYVGQRGKGAPPILVLDSTGKLLRSFGQDADIGTMHGMHMQQLGGGKQALWITDAHNSKVHKFDPHTEQWSTSMVLAKVSAEPFAVRSMPDL